MTTPTKFLIAALLLVACAEDQVGSSTSQVSTGSSGDSTGSTTGDEADSSSSSSEGSSTSSTGAESTSGDSSGEPVDPDPQPGAGHMWGRCEGTSQLVCPAMDCMVYDQWGGEGFCTPSCNTVEGCTSSGEPLKSGATLVCESIYPNSLKYCLLACSGDSQCLGGMECLQLPNADPDSPVQTVCA